MAFEIEEGYVEVDARVNRTGIRAAAESAGHEAGQSLERGVRKGAEDSANSNKSKYGGILRKAFTPNPDMFNALRAPFAAALSTPVGAAGVAVAAAFAASFIGALAASLATAGLGAVFLGIGVIALKENEKIAKAFERLGSRVKKSLEGAAAPLIAPLVAAMDALGDSMERVAPLLKQIFGDLAPVIPVLTAGVTGFVEEFLKILTADPATLQGMRDALAAIGENLPRVGVALGQMFATLASNENTVKNIGVFFSILVNTINVLGFALNQASNQFALMVAAWHAIQNAVSAFVSWLTGTAGPAIGNFFTVTIPGWINSAVAFFMSLPGRIGSAIAAIPGLLASLFTRAFDLVTTAIGVGIGTAVRLMLTLPGKIVAAIASIPGRIAAVLNAARSLMISIATGAVSAAVSIFTTLPGRVASAISAVRSRIQGVFSGAGSWLVSAGRSIIQGVANGIVGAIGGAVAAARRAAQNIVNGFKSALKIGSPSKLAAIEVGRPFMQGVGVGVKDNLKLAIRPLNDLTKMFGSIAGPSVSGSSGVDSASMRPAAGASRGGGLTLSIGSVQVSVASAPGGNPRETGDVIAEQIISRLGSAVLARGGRW